MNTKLVNKAPLITILLLIAPLLYGNAQDGRLDDKIDEITYKWDEEAIELAKYEGLLKLCGDEEYRTMIFDLLDEIHHYDTILYEVLLKLEKRTKDKEVKQTLEEIREFETEFNSKSFRKFMQEECHEAKLIERNADEIRNDVGHNSYSGKVYILELDLYKYVQHTTRSIDRIRKHIHHIGKHYSN